MPHKLLIVPKVFPPRKYRKFLAFFEAVTSTPNTIKFEIKNIGKETFPGGEIPKGCVNFEQVVGMATFTQPFRVTPEVPTIQPNETGTVNLKGWNPFSPGLWKILMKIKSKDNANIEFYQTSNGSPLEDEWNQTVYAVDRHQLDLTLLLERSLKKKS